MPFVSEDIIVDLLKIQNILEDIRISTLKYKTCNRCKQIFIGKKKICSKHGKLSKRSMKIINKINEK